MKALVASLVVLVSISLSCKGDEPTGSENDEGAKNVGFRGGLVELLLPNSELGTNWQHNIAALIDPQAHPKEFFLPEHSDNADRHLLQNTHSEAVIRAWYFRTSHPKEKWSVEVVRFPNADVAQKAMEHRWGEHKKIGNLDVLYLKPGGLPYGLVGGNLSFLQGRYFVNVSPTKPDSDTFGGTIAQLMAARIVNLTK